MDGEETRGQVMKIKDLIAKLQELNPDIKVYSMGPDYGGYDYTIFTNVKLYLNRNESKVLLGNAEQSSWFINNKDWDKAFSSELGE